MSSCDKNGSSCDIPLSTEEASWVGSVAGIGAMAAGPVVGVAMAAVGRRLLMMAAAPVALLGWVLLTFASGPAMLYAGRFLCGFACGPFAVLTTVYSSEIAEMRVRGAMGGMMQTMYMLGVLFVYILGEWGLI